MTPSTLTTCSVCGGPLVRDVRWRAEDETPGWLCAACGALYYLDGRRMRYNARAEDIAWAKEHRP